VYGSNQVELAWTIIPILIVVALFMATARVIAVVQKTSQRQVTQSRLRPSVISSGGSTVIQQLGVVTANELHVPVSDPAHPTPTFINLLSADTDHSFWVPRLAGKTDLIPNHPNTHVDRSAGDRSLPGPVCAVLRHPARQDVAACLCSVEG
jgi:cytochrome c oxidase subunit II